MSAEKTLSRWVTAAAAVLSMGLAVGPPAAWYFFSYERLAGGLDAEAEIASHLITQAIGQNPELWRFERLRLEELLSRRPRKGDPEIRRIVDLAGEVVAESADPLPGPWILRSLPLLDAGVPVATVEIHRSIRPLLLGAGLLGLVLLVPAYLFFHLLRTLPLEALHRSEGALRRQRDTAQQYLDVAGVAFVILDAAGRVSLVNPRASELLGRNSSEVLGRAWVEAFVDPADRRRFLAESAAARTGEVATLEFSVVRATGDRRIVSGYVTRLAGEDGAPSGLLLSGVDITHQRQLEEQLRHALKQRAVGQLAGGVAHDFNKIVAAIRTRAVLLRADLAVGNPHRLDAEEILAAADRAAALTKSLLTFSRRQALSAEPLDLCELLARALRRLQRLLPTEITLVTELPARQLPVVGDAAQLEQVLQNLITHARDAIQGVGRVVVSAASTTLDADAAQRLGLQAEGDYAEVSVTDSGPGLDPEAQARLFDPSQSGPEAGRGAGLGLAIAVGIVELHGGAIRARSEPGRGTTISFLLPQGDAARAVAGDDAAA